MSTVLMSTSCAYHVSPAGKDEASEWIAGGAKKGLVDGRRALGLYRFDEDAISAALNGVNLPGAKLILAREAAYGTGEVDICLQMLTDDGGLGSMTHAECLAIGERDKHTLVTVSGESPVIPLPGYWLWYIKNHGITGIMIYQEEEGTDAPAYFGETAKLQLDIGDQWEAPVWTRPVGTGDIISDSLRSHVADLRELTYYINIRSRVDGRSEISIDSYIDENESALYSDWPAIIRELQDAEDVIVEAESKTAIGWKRAAANDIPDAEIVNQLRNFMESDISGPKETVAVTTYGRTYFDHYDSDFTVNLNTTTTWAKKGPWNGMNWEYVTVDGVKRKKYNRRFGIWIFRNKVAGKTVTSLKLRVKRAEGTGSNKEIRLFPVKVSAVPTSKMSINQVMVTSTVVGRGTASVGGTVDISLSADFISKLMDGTYYGVGVFDKDYWTNFGTSATLIING